MTAAGNSVTVLSLPALLLFGLLEQAIQVKGKHAAFQKHAHTLRVASRTRDK